MKNKLHYKIGESIEQLFARKPFYSEVLTMCSFNESTLLSTAGVNCKKGRFNFAYNKSFIDSLNEKQVNYLNIHEVMHLIANHLGRSSFLNMNHKLMNIVADMIINSTIETKMKGYGVYLERPSINPWLVPDEYQGEWVVEDLYNWMVNNNKVDFYTCSYFDEHPEDEETSAEERDTIIREILQSCKSRGLVTSEEDLIIHTLFRPPNNPLKRVKGFLSSQIKRVKERTWARASIIGVGKGFRRTSREFTVILDTSGSMMAKFKKVLGFLLIKDVVINLVQIDTEIKSVKKISRPDQIRSLNIRGLGGTELQPAIEYVKKNLSHSPLAILTDGYTEELDLRGIPGVTSIITTDTFSVSVGKYKVFKI
jgi:predicted metal-dependent peptidase